MTPDLPSKGAHDAPYQVQRRDAPTKPGPEEEARKADIRAQSVDAAVKAPFDAAAAEKAAAAETPTKGGSKPPRNPDQVVQPYRPEPEGEQYLRLTVRVEDGVFSIVDSHLVAGPLAQTQTLQGGHAYEVSAQGRVLHVGSIPDLGTFRSFANPKGTLEQHRHHSYQLTTYEFDARVSLAELRGVDPATVSIALFRVKQADVVGTPPATLDVRSFAMKREQQLREVGRVAGIPASALPDGFVTSASTIAPQRPDVRKVRDPNERPDDDEEAAAD